MLLVLIALVSYAVCSACLYLAMYVRCKKNLVFKAPKHRAVYYLLSLTWGLPVTLIGCIVALVLVCFGHKPKKHGWGWCFEFDNIGWGLELGLFFIAPSDDDDNYLKNHELGHGVQNVYFGIFMPAVVCIPSIIRYWYRELMEKIGRDLNTAYDDIWFEGSATESGYALMKDIEEK